MAGDAVARSQGSPHGLGASGRGAVGKARVARRVGGGEYKRVFQKHGLGG
jgi:hypothetical protein